MIGVALMLAAALSNAPEAADPLAPARAGLLQCYTPHPERKTCRALASYVFNKDGSIVNPAATLISPEPLVVMKTHDPVTIKAGAVCGQIHRASIQGAAFDVDGQPASAGQAETLRNQVTAAYTKIFDKEICTTYTLKGSAYQASTTVGGEPSADATDAVIWVKPGDGYKVGN